MIAKLAAWICLIWYSAVAVVGTLGYVQLRRYYTKAPPVLPVDKSLQGDDLPHITAIRPVKGLEPSLYACLAATFRQTYPRNKLTIYFCIADRRDPALPTLQRLLNDFPTFDAKIMVEEEDEQAERLGPNPKIRNMSRAYREAKGDVIWIIDCNVWVGKGVARRMVAQLREGKKQNKFVHQLPIVVDVDEKGSSGEATGVQVGAKDGMQVSSTSTSSFEVHSTRSRQKGLKGSLQLGGGRLEELFMSSSHAKFYTAINTVLIAPCIVGKSNMFRRSHLDSLTEQQGIDYFSYNICEDHLIGDRLWRRDVPDEKRSGKKLGKHALVFGDLCIQPMANMSVSEYAARRVRWLRVRKFTVLTATLVEPGTESFLCSLYGAYAVTSLHWIHRLGMPQTWTAFAAFWLLSVAIWAAFDRSLYWILQSAASIEVDEHTPDFARPPPPGRTRRSFGRWLTAWIGREAMAFPVWVWAIYGGVSVKWRGKRMWVGMDMKVHEIPDRKKDD